jgi:hypothetical protein
MSRHAEEGDSHTTNNQPLPRDVEKPLAGPDDSSSIEEQIKLAKAEGIKPAFMAKVGVLNDAISDIGMGRYQYELFITAGTSTLHYTLLLPSSTLLGFGFGHGVDGDIVGFGWFADNICKSPK